MACRCRTSIDGGPLLIPSGPFFFYGTLLDPEILQLVLGRRISTAHHVPAIIRDYGRFYKNGALYPVFIDAPGKTVAGRLLRGLSHREARQIDGFEDGGYRKLRSPVTTADGETVDAWV